MASIDAFGNLEHRMDAFQQDVAHVLSRQQDHARQQLQRFQEEMRHLHGQHQHLVDELQRLAAQRTALQQQIRAAEQTTSTTREQWRGYHEREGELSRRQQTLAAQSRELDALLQQRGAECAELRARWAAQVGNDATEVALYERLLQLRVVPGARDARDVRFVFGDDGSSRWVEVAMHGDHVLGECRPELDASRRGTLEHVLDVEGDLGAFLVVARDMLLGSL
ncbi:SUVZ05G0885 [Saccharomyces uvarum]|uniref:SUVZ05G0885 protein n=1 Tax=Saccharomyces uvarum TaxID=230603 RepID=A0ABN8WX73_SACUV|nr:SUVZ05G0885 [Saccharomyces uvarum]